MPFYKYTKYYKNKYYKNKNIIIILVFTLIGVKPCI